MLWDLWLIRGQRDTIQYLAMIITSVWVDFYRNQTLAVYLVMIRFEKEFTVIEKQLPVRVSAVSSNEIKKESGMIRSGG